MMSSINITSKFNTNNRMLNRMISNILFFFMFFETILSTEAANAVSQELRTLNYNVPYPQRVIFYGGKEDVNEQGVYELTDLATWFTHFDKVKEYLYKNGNSNPEEPIDVSDFVHKDIFEDIYKFLTGEKPYFEKVTFDHFLVMSDLGLKDEYCKSVIECMLENSTDVIEDIKNLVMDVDCVADFNLLTPYIKYVTQIYKFVDIAANGRFKIWSVPDGCEDYEGNDHHVVNLEKKQYEAMDEMFKKYRELSMKEEEETEKREAEKKGQRTIFSEPMEITVN